tara:strand:+ start:69 stop:476 length:408 start_codon:yes stop_codon:yes gene_type:complete
MSKEKTISDKDSLKSRIASMNRDIASPKMIVNEAYAMAQALQGGSGGRTISDQDIKNIALTLQGGSGGRTISDQDIKNILKKLKKEKEFVKKHGLNVNMFELTDKKGKPNLKKGGSVKTYSKGGGVRKPKMTAGY